MVSVTALAIIFLIAIVALVGQRQLLPGIVMLGSFILFVLWLTGLIETSIQLYGPSGSVNTFCSMNRPVGGTALETMAWLANNGICEFIDPCDCRAERVWELIRPVRLGLESCLRVRNRRDGVFAMDDGHGVSGQ